VRLLLDINVVIALIDPEHSFHLKAHNFWEDSGSKKWASCPLVENGVVRILTGTNYPGWAAYSNESVFELFRTLINNSDHEFWADDISLLDQSRFDAKFILGPKQLTDIYLLGLAVSNGGRLITFDRKITPAPVPGATENNLSVLS
jgi:uncharacterized protein